MTEALVRKADAPSSASPARTHPHTEGVKLKHRPALDGLRGFAVTACLLYQTLSSVLTGAWIGVDMFLVLSGFFIAAMLLREHRKWGRIDYFGFLARRARRLLPTQFFMLGVVLLGSLLLIVPSRRASVAWDTVASMGQVINWRFIASDFSYFNNLSIPTPLRHMWSLNVQEQFYLVFPFVVAGLFAISRRRAVQIGLLALLAGVSVWRMATLYVPGTDPSRVYFGTDTRIFEVIIGVIAAYLISERSFAMGSGRQHRGWLDRWDNVIGWAGLASLITLAVLMFVISEYSTFVFQGGLVLVCLLTLVAIVAASGPNPNVLQRILSWKPLRTVGIMGYSLYIWHWPALVFSMLALSSFPVWVRHVVAMIATVLIGTWAYRHIEEPAHRRGLRALLPGKPRLRRFAVVATVPAVLLGSVGLANSSELWMLSGRGSNVRLAVPTYEPGLTSQSIVVLGNSVADSAVRARGTSTPDLQISLVARFGCDPFARDRVTANGTIPPTQECLDYQRTWAQKIKTVENPFLVYFMPINLLADYVVDGASVRAGTPAHDQLVEGALEEVRTSAMANGATGMALNNLACHRLDDFGNDPLIARANQVEAVRHLNSVAAGWASRVGVTVIDTYGALCPTDVPNSTINGTLLYGDHLHFTPDSGLIYWQWLAPQMRAAAQRATRGVTAAR